MLKKTHLADTSRVCFSLLHQGGLLEIKGGQLGNWRAVRFHLLGDLNILHIFPSAG